MGANQIGAISSEMPRPRRGLDRSLPVVAWETRFCQIRCDEVAREARLLLPWWQLAVPICHYLRCGTRTTASQRLQPVVSGRRAHGPGPTAVIDLPGQGRRERPVYEVLLT
jgi:hypothetical protein